MKNLKKWTALFLTMAVGMGSLAGCGSQTAEATKESEKSAEVSEAVSEETQAAEATEVAEEDPFLTGEKPVLNILYYNQAYDMNADAAKKIMEELTGYEVVYHNLPAENASEKMMLEIASGAEYDMIYRAKTADYAQLVAQNAAMDVTELLEKYGSNILANVNEKDWSIVTNDDGSITGIPYPGSQQPADTLYGNFTGGIAFRSDLLEDLNLEIPQTLDELYNVLKAYKDATGNAALTMGKGGWVAPILSAFGMSNAVWYDVDGTLTHRVRMDGFKDYVEFMQKLYKEGLLDNDMPINASANAREKFANGTALCMPLNFWDIPTIKEAMAVNNPDAKAVFSVALAKDEETPGYVSVANGASEVCVIPKTAKNPEHAMIWYNIISDPELCKQIYLGEEGVSYEVVDGNYYPLFPAFDEYVNSDKFTGSVEGGEMKKQWMARARKTTEMAEAFDQMNENADQYTRYDTVENYATSLPAIKENLAALTTATSDILIAGIVEGTDAQAVVDDIIATWEREGGLECEAEINEWYAEFNK
ncbi:MAG: extracellular solute-binding protein [Lachnospiraceae bacterium]|nr:extracellular solute-binding protein [Lachnospiraceae bacterium]